jgi:calcineurin-like phosphoesterase family protein
MEFRMIWFTSDTHFCHENIIKYCQRPYASASEMDESIIEKYNEVVKDNDIVYHLGDFSMDSYTPEIKAIREPYLVEVFKRLKGKKILIIGNHDHSYLELYSGLFQTMLPYYEIKNDADRSKIILSHYPFESWNGKNYGWIHLHGHSHGQALIVKNRYDVGIDTNNFYPISIDDMFIKLKQQNKILNAIKKEEKENAVINETKKEKITAKKIKTSEIKIPVKKIKEDNISLEQISDIISSEIKKQLQPIKKQLKNIEVKKTNTKIKK